MEDRRTMATHRQHGGIRRRWSALVALPVVALASAACGASAGTGSGSGSGGFTTITVGGLPAEGIMNLYAAIDLGYFKQAGINIKFVDTTSVVPLVTGQVDIQPVGLETPALYAEQGKPLPIIAIMQEHGENSLYARAGLNLPKSYPANVNALRHLIKGKIKVGVGLLKSGSAIVSGAPLGVAGLKVGKDFSYEVLNSNTNVLAALESGKIDLASTAPPWDAQGAAAGMQPVALEAGGIGSSLFTNLYGTMISANKAWADSHTALVRKFNAILAKANEYVADYSAHKTRLIAIAVKYTGTPKKYLAIDMPTVSNLASQGSNVSCQHVEAAVGLDVKYGVLDSAPSCAVLVDKAAFGSRLKG